MAAVTKVGTGVYRVDVNGRMETVHVAGPPSDRWAFWNGRVFRLPAGSGPQPARRPRADHGGPGRRLTAPMPATVIRVLVKTGDDVRKGDTVLILEAMKMELPLRAPSDARVTSVPCREGEMVQADTVLVELE